MISSVLWCPKSYRMFRLSPLTRQNCWHSLLKSTRKSRMAASSPSLSPTRFRIVSRVATVLEIGSSLVMDQYSDLQFRLIVCVCVCVCFNQFSGYIVCSDIEKALQVVSTIQYSLQSASIYPRTTIVCVCVCVVVTLSRICVCSSA